MTFTDPGRRWPDLPTPAPPVPPAPVALPKPAVKKPAPRTPAPKRAVLPTQVVPPDAPPPDAAGAHTRTPQALGTDDPGQRRLGEPKPGEPSAAEDPNNPINQNADPAVRDFRRLEGKLADRLGKLLEKNEKTNEYKSGIETLVARYLENHGRWEHVTHRDHAGARVADTHVGCECPICDDARAALKLEG